LSKIHKALEKAQREREGDFPRDFLLIPEMEEEKGEKGKEDLEPLKPERIISDQKLVTFYEPSSLAAEQFRKLRTQLLRLKLPHPPKTILVTSATPGEGKTLVSVNLAAEIAYEFHAYALLVDCDLRNPCLGQWFGACLQNGGGLADYLIGKKEIPELLVKTEVEKLKVIFGGTIRDNPAELIGSAKMEALIQELKSRYNDRYIILDSTPLLSTSESEVLSKFVDGIIVVVRAGVTPRETVKQAISSLEKEKILGFVLNGLEFKSSGLSSRYFGSDDSYYGYQSGDGRRRSK
jgi:protein-tyrosine kinase